MLPAEADTQRACALSRFTDVKTGAQLYVLMFCFFCVAVLMYAFVKHETYRIEFSVVSFSALQLYRAAQSNHFCSL